MIKYQGFNIQIKREANGKHTYRYRDAEPLAPSRNEWQDDGREYDSYELALRAARDAIDDWYREAEKLFGK